LVRELEPDFEFGDGERRICNRSRKEGRNLKVPDDASWEAAPTWSVKRRETGRMDGGNFKRVSARMVVWVLANMG
jgi:hypothetical protein